MQASLSSGIFPSKRVPYASSNVPRDISVNERDPYASIHVPQDIRVNKMHGVTLTPSELSQAKTLHSQKSWGTYKIMSILTHDASALTHCSSRSGGRCHSPNIFIVKFTHFPPGCRLPRETKTPPPAYTHLSPTNPYRPPTTHGRGGWYIFTHPFQFVLQNHHSNSTCTWCYKNDSTQIPSS